MLYQEVAAIKGAEFFVSVYIVKDAWWIPMNVVIFSGRESGKLR